MTVLPQAEIVQNSIFLAGVPPRKCTPQPKKSGLILEADSADRIENLSWSERPQTTEIGICDSKKRTETKFRHAIFEVIEKRKFDLLTSILCIHGRDISTLLYIYICIYIYISMEEDVHGVERCFYTMDIHGVEISLRHTSMVQRCLCAMYLW